MFRKEDIDRLISYDAYPAITFSLPTHMGSREVRQDRIRLRNFSAAAADRLAAAGVDRGAAEQLLAPVRRLGDDEAFWLEQSPGLVLFVAPGLFEIMRLPFSPAEELTVGRRFHLRHLLPALDGDYPFFVLTISARHARLHHGSRYDLHETQSDDFPIQWREMPKEISDPAREGNGGGRRVISQDLRRSDFADFFSRVADAAVRQTNGRDIPIVLVAIPEFAGHFRSVARLRNLTGEDVNENPEVLGKRELHRLAYEKMRPLFAGKEDQALEKFNLVFGQGQPRASIDLAEVVEAARSGRVDTLFVADDTHLWGRLDPASGLVQHSEQSPEDEDLLDYATAETWRNGGAVRVLPRSSAPFGKPVSAIFRY
jgi:hypothetical protein